MHYDILCMSTSQWSAMCHSFMIMLGGSSCHGTHVGMQKHASVKEYLANLDLAASSFTWWWRPGQNSETQKGKFVGGDSSNPAPAGSTSAIWFGTGLWTTISFSCFASIQWLDHPYENFCYIVFGGNACKQPWFLIALNRTALTPHWADSCDTIL